MTIRPIDFGTDLGQFNVINTVERPETSKRDVLGPIVAFIVPVLARPVRQVRAMRGTIILNGVILLFVAGRTRPMDGDDLPDARGRALRPDARQQQAHKPHPDGRAGRRAREGQVGSTGHWLERGRSTPRRTVDGGRIVIK